MKENLFQMYELEALLGDQASDFDIDAIIAEATEIDADGDRVWTAFGEDLYEIIARHDHPRAKAEFRAMRETLGITQQRLADDLDVKVLSVKRWESPNYPQQAPQDAWNLLDMLMERQDTAVRVALLEVDAIAEDRGEQPEEVTLPYWSSDSDYYQHHITRDHGDESWTEVNATARRIAIALRDRGIRVRWVDGKDNPVPKM